MDIACGTGLFTRNLAKHSYHTWGIDISMEMLKQGSINIHKENLNNITLARADVYGLPFPNSMFHGVSCIGAMQLFTDLDHALAEINRVIMDGGSMAAVTYINRGKWEDNDRQNYLKKLDIHFFDIDEIEDHLEKNRFKNFKYTINSSMIFFSCTAD